MKSLYYKLLLLVLVAALAAPFILRDGDGRPLMSLDQISMPQIATPDLPDVGAIVDEARHRLSPGAGEAAAETRVYKWRDANGAWHFSDSAVAGAEPVELDPDANLVRLETPGETPGEPAASPAPDPPASQAAGDPAQGPALIERARDIDRLVQERDTKQRRVLDRL